MLLGALLYLAQEMCNTPIQLIVFLSQLKADLDAPPTLQFIAIHGFEAL